MILGVPRKYFTKKKSVETSSDSVSRVHWVLRYANGRLAGVRELVGSFVPRAIYSEADLHVFLWHLEAEMVCEDDKDQVHVIFEATAPDHRCA